MTVSFYVKLGASAAWVALGIEWHHWLVFLIGVVTGGVLISARARS